MERAIECFFSLFKTKITYSILSSISLITLLVGTPLYSESAVYTTPYTVNTLSGSPLIGSGWQDGAAQSALFNQPNGLVADKSGNLYVADSGNYVIRMINLTTNQVTTIAGSGTVSGSLDGIGINAKFGFLKGIAIDASGNLYVTDSTYNTVRKISLIDGNWTVSTVVSSAAGLKQPTGIAIDSAGNIYISDTGNSVIRKISASPTYTLSTLAGTIGSAGGLDSGSAGGPTFGGPSGIAVDSNRNIYVLDNASSTLRKISSTGQVTTIGGFIGVPGLIDGPLSTAAAQFSQPYALTSDSSGNLYLSDQANLSLLRKIANPASLSSAYISSLAGVAGVNGYYDGTGAKAYFGGIRGIAVDQNGTIYTADNNYSSIRKATLGSIPSITSLTQTGTVGSLFSLTLTATNTPQSFTLSSGSLPPGLSFNTSTGAINGIPTAAGSYSMSFNATNTAGISPPGQITIVISPTITLSSITSLGVTTGYIGTPFSYQITATNSPTLLIASGLLPKGITANNATGLISGIPTTAGTFTLNLYAYNSNGAGPMTSLVITIYQANQGITITSQPISYTLNPGSSVTLSVAATGDALTYQWYLNGIAIPGASSPSYMISSALPTNAGSYSVTITNNTGTLTSQAAQINVINPGRLTNLSVLSLDGPGSQLLTVGFVTGGAGTSGYQNLLIRGSGPAIGLSPFNVNNVLPDPNLTVFSSNTQVASNDNWGTPSSNATAVTAANTATGAFALTNTSSFDAALVCNLIAGGYSVQVAGKNGSIGNVLAEVYDNTAANSYTVKTPRLVNLSCLEQVASGGILSTGFVIGGTTPEQVLIRVSGPTLGAAPFNLVGTIPDPKVTVFNSASTVLATNTGWDGNVAITAANNLTGAFQFSSTSSKDSAVLLTLQPGAYTVQATSASGTAGVTLIEIYEVPGN